MAEKEHEVKDLTCSVCLEDFKQPKVLPCCHTFCKGCLERILEKSGQKGSLICPQCRAEHSVPVGGTGAFSTDFTVLQAFRKHSLTAKRMSCGMCSSQDAPPASFCEECEEYLCEYCNGAHRRMKLFTDHNVVALSEFKLESFNPKPKVYYCQQHPQNVVQLFCETCNQLLCGNCVVHSQSSSLHMFGSSSRQSMHTLTGSRHSMHTLTALSDGSKPMEKKLKELIVSADRNRKQCLSNLNSLDKIEEQREHYTQQLKAQVNTAVDLYIKCLEASRVRTLKEIDAKSSQESEDNQAQKQHLTSTVTCLNSDLKFALKALRCHDNTERIAMIGHAMSQLKQPTKPRIVQTKIPLPLVVEDLEKKLQTLLREFKSSDISILGANGDARVQLGKKSQLKVTIRVKPVGEPQFQIKYGASYQCSFTPQTTLESDNTWLLEFTPCCGGRHAVGVCVYGVWISCDAYASTDVLTFYVEGTLKEGDIVRRMPSQLDAPVKAEETTGKVTSATRNLLSKCPSNTYTVRVKWTEGEEESEESFQWGEPLCYPLELVL